MMRVKTKLTDSKQEYSGLTFEQVKMLAELRNQGYTEEQALEMINND